MQGILLGADVHGELVHAGSLAGEEIKEPVDPDDYNEAADGARGCRRCASAVSQALVGKMHRGYGRGGYGGCCMQ